MHFASNVLLHFENWGYTFLAVKWKKGDFFLHFILLTYSYLVQGRKMLTFLSLFQQTTTKLISALQKPQISNFVFYVTDSHPDVMAGHQLSKPLWTPASDVSCHLNLDICLLFFFMAKMWR